MPYYMVLFSYDHHPGDFIQPASVLGGPMGQTDRGILAVYDVPGSEADRFEAKARDCASILECKPVKVKP